LILEGVYLNLFFSMNIYEYPFYGFIIFSYFSILEALSTAHFLLLYYRW